MLTGSASTSCLYIVATPIGNLSDISERALAILREVDAIAAEDTRHSSRLLAHYGINTPLLALHEHNERFRVEDLLRQLQAGKSLALISDAGTPLISDPGFQLVKAAREAGVRVSPVPGPSALIAALSCAGLPSDAFLFEGFLPSRQAARLTKLHSLKNEERTLIFYEAPHRLLDCLGDLKNTFGEERHAVLARELTKTFETVHGDTLAELHEWVAADNNQQRGEIVLLVQGKSRRPGNEQNKTEIDEESGRILDILLEELSLKQASSLAAKITGRKKNSLYELALHKTGKNQ